MKSSDKPPKGTVAHTCPECGWTSYQLPTVKVWCGNPACHDSKDRSYLCEQVKSV